MDLLPNNYMLFRWNNFRQYDLQHTKKEPRELTQLEIESNENEVKKLDADVIDSLFSHRKLPMFSIRAASVIGKDIGINLGLSVLMGFRLLVSCLH